MKNVNKLILALILFISLLIIAKSLSLHFTLNIGVSFLIALIVAEVLFEWGIPRLSSFLIIGLILGPYCTNIIDFTHLAKIKFLDNLALGMIALIAGCEINIRKDLKLFINYGKFTFFQLIILSVLAFPLIFLTFKLMLPDFAFLAPVILLTLIFNATSPSTTIAIIKETKSSSNLATLVLTSAIIKDILMILLFTSTLSIFTTNDTSILNVFLHEVYSILTGVILGILTVLYIKHININLGSFFLIILIAVSILAKNIHLNSLLLFLFTGITLNNFSPYGHRVNELFETNFELILLIFFFSAGAVINLSALKSMFIVAILLFLIRGFTLYLSALLSGRISNISKKVSGYSTLGFLSQAGVSIGFAKIIAENFKWGDNFATLLFAIISINQLVGPLLFKWGLNRVKE